MAVNAPLGANQLFYCLSCRKVKYLNMKGSLVDEHTVKGLTKAGKEVHYLFIYTFSQSQYNHNL